MPASVPPDDDRRGEFYDDPPLEVDEDEGDYEVEPPDAEVLASEKRRAEAEMRRAQTAASLQELDEQAYETADSQLIKLKELDFKWQFGTKHLLLATAGLSVFMAFVTTIGPGKTIAIMVMGGLAAAHLYLAWQDRKRMEKLEERRQELVRLARESDDEEAKGPLTIYDMPDEEVEKLTPSRPPIRLQFSMKHMMIAVTIGCVLLGLLSLFDPGPLSAVFGLIAVAGVAAYATGFEPPAPVVMGWWIVLLMYIATSLIGAVMRQQ